MSSYQCARPEDQTQFFTLEGLASEFGIGKHAIRKYIENGHVPPSLGKHPNGLNYDHTHYRALASIRAERQAVRLVSQSVRTLSRSHCVVRTQRAEGPSRASA